MSETESTWKYNHPPLAYLEAGFHMLGRLDNGIEIAVIKMLFTWDLCYNINPDSMFDAYDYRYMYETEGEAVKACVLWDGDGHPPGNWIKRKGGGPDLDNPDYKPNDNSMD